MGTSTVDTVLPAQRPAGAPGAPGPGARPPAAESAAAVGPAVASGPEAPARAQDPPAGSPSRRAGGRGGAEDDARAPLITGILFWAGVAAVLLLANEESRWVVRDWWPALAVALLLVVAAAALPAVTHWIRNRTSVTRAGLFIFVLVPFVVLCVASVSVLPAQWQVAALRGVFVAVMCLLPAAMWYLFIAAQKASLLNEFVANLDRLGLLAATDADPVTGDAHVARSRRISSYLQKFEATYGPLPATVHDDVLTNGARQYTRADAGTGAPLSTTTVPVLLSTVLVTLGWLATLPIGEAPEGLTQELRWLQAFLPSATPVTFAFLGAYFFSLQMLFRRYVRKDLRGSAYVAVAMRIVLAVIGTWVVVAVSGLAGWESSSQLLLLGFVIGVFPRVAWQLVQAVFAHTTRIVLHGMVSELPLSDLDGLTVWHEARLEEEDIENVPNMASADVVDLLVNTRFPADRVVDWVDQALLLTQLGPGGKAGGESSARSRLGAHGIRTASALLRTQDAAKAAGRGARFERILLDADGRTVLPDLAVALRTNPNLDLVVTWRRTAGRERPVC